MAARVTLFYVVADHCSCAGMHLELVSLCWLVELCGHLNLVDSLCSHFNWLCNEFCGQGDLLPYLWFWVARISKKSYYSCMFFVVLMVFTHLLTINQECQELSISEKPFSQASQWILCWNSRCFYCLHDDRAK